MGKKLHMAHLPARKEVLHAFSSHEKIKKVFGHRAPVDLEKGIERMAKWALSVGPRQTTEFKDIEVYKNLPPAWTRK
jgi:UDP-glucose 4-epimerase